MSLAYGSIFFYSCGAWYTTSNENINSSPYNLFLFYFWRRLMVYSITIISNILSVHTLRNLSNAKSVLIFFKKKNFKIIINFNIIDPTDQWVHNRSQPFPFAINAIHFTKVIELWLESEYPIWAFYSLATKLDSQWC